MKLLHKIIGTGINLSSLVAPKWAIQKTVDIFSIPQSSVIRPKEKAFLDTAQQKRTLRFGCDIVEYHWGKADAPLIVLSYGWAYNAGRWRHFVEALLAAGFRVIAYDPPGHGYAPPKSVNLVLNSAFIQAIIEENGAPEAIVAHSFGGAASVYATQNLPKHLQPKKLVLMAAFSYAPRVFKAFAESLGLWKVNYKGMTAHFENVIQKPLRHFDLALMTSNLPQVQGFIVHSPNDEVTPFSNALRFHSYWANSFLYAPEEGGHHLGTNDITKAILNFVIKDIAPESADKQLNPNDENHELASFFEGVY